MPRKGERATPAQRSALKAGQEKRAKALADPTADESAKVRHAKLLDGSLTVSDLTDEEVERCRVYGKGKVFQGKSAPLPSHLVAAFREEQIKRAKALLSSDLIKASKALGKVLDDPEATNNDKIKAATILLDRGLGRTPETVNIKAVDPWGEMLAAGASVRDARDLTSLDEGSVSASDIGGE